MEFLSRLQAPEALPSPLITLHPALWPGKNKLCNVLAASPGMQGGGAGTPQLPAPHTTPKSHGLAITPGMYLHRGHAHLHVSETVSSILADPNMDLAMLQLNTFKNIQGKNKEWGNFPFLFYHLHKLRHKTYFTGWKMGSKSNQ